MSSTIILIYELVTSKQQKRVLNLGAYVEHDDDETSQIDAVGRTKQKKKQKLNEKMRKLKMNIR